MDSFLTNVEPERYEFDNQSWVDIFRGWLGDPNTVYRALVETVPWQQGRLWRYERWVDEPRLGASFRSDDMPHPALVETQRALQSRYRVQFGGAGVAYYRNGRDGQAFHRDTDMRYLEDTIVGILTFGTQRPFYVAPRGRRDKFIGPKGGATHNLAPASGDLLVFGGRFQTDWEHSVPVMREVTTGRISVQWRWSSRRGRPELMPSYSAPRDFSKPRPR
jgi:alkylated DNA repair dioxygenase AlkB